MRMIIKSFLKKQKQQQQNSTRKKSKKLPTFGIWKAPELS